MKFIDKLERKYGRHFGIPNLMQYLVMLMGVTYILQLVDRKGTYLYALMLFPEKVLEGQIWRLLTFIVIPPSAGIIFIIFVLMFYYYIGSSLEHEWGTFRFNLYYFMGVIFTIIGSFITGIPGTSLYINLSLFLAFAYLYPDYQIRLYMIVPIKVKYLAWLNWAFLAYTIIFSPEMRVFALISILNYIVYFGKDVFTVGINRVKAYQRKKNYKQSIKDAWKKK